MFRYVSAGCAFKSEDGDYYTFDIATPYIYETEEAALKDTTIYRFRKEDKQIKLIAYQKEWFKTETGKDGTKYARSIPAGDPVSKYTYRQFIELGGRLLKNIGTGEFEDAESTFDDLFPSLAPGSEIHIERGLAGAIYKI